MYAQKSLGNVLKTYRLGRQMSLREFGELLEISHAYVNKLERGSDPRTGMDVTPTIDMLLRIADKLEIDRQEFLSMCGYFDKAPTREPETAVKLESIVENAQIELSEAKSVYYKGVAVRKEDLTVLETSVEIGLAILAKRLLNH